MRPQIRIECVAHRVGLALHGEVEMRDLAERMDPGIGAARALHHRLLAAEGLDRRHDDALHRQVLVLQLPADERRSVILDDDLVAWHGCQLSAAPTLIFAPRRNSSARIGLPPAFCNSTIRTAPVSQAMVRGSSSTVPGAPLPSPRALRSTLTRSRPNSNHAPGNGARPRTWSWTLFQGLAQSMRVSALSILAA